MICRCDGPPISYRLPVLVPGWQVPALSHMPCGTRADLGLAEEDMADEHSSRSPQSTIYSCMKPQREKERFIL